MPCELCQAMSRDGKVCQRKASCHQGCFEFCWQHAKMYREGRAEGEWQKGKGCTGKKLYQYRKKPGPKTGLCNSKTMIGASGRCVARTPVNLARKKEALAARKLGGKKASGKKKAPPRDSYPFEAGDDGSDEEDVLGIRINGNGKKTPHQFGAGDSNSDEDDFYKHLEELQSLSGPELTRRLRHYGISLNDYSKAMGCMEDEFFLPYNRSCRKRIIV